MKYLFLAFALCCTGCIGEISFSEQCDARQNYGLKGPVKSFTYDVENYNSDKTDLWWRAEIYSLSANSTYEFDRHGNISCKITPYYIQKYDYDKQNQRIKTKICYDDKTCYESKWTYDEEGRLIHGEKECGDGEWYPEHTFIVDVEYISKCDTLAKYVYKNKRIGMDGEIIEETSSPVSIYYNADGKPISIISPAADVADADVNGIFDMGRYENRDTFSSIAYFQYDTEGRISLKRFYNNEEEVVYQCNYQYDANGRLTVSAEAGGYRDGSDAWINAGKIGTTRVEYNKYTPITIISYNYDNDLEHINDHATSAEVVYEHNSDEHDWNRVKEIGNITYAHEYDKYGNWITRLSYIDQTLYKIEKREIKYYGDDSSRYNEEYVKQARDIAEKQRQQEEKRRKEIEKQPIEIEFTKAVFRMDSCYDRVIFTFEAKLRNRSDKTFISADFEEEYIAKSLFGEYESTRVATYVTMYFNKKYILRYDKFGFYDSNFSYELIPSASFNDPWKPEEAQTFKLGLTNYDSDQVTKGFMGYTPRSCILHMLITVEEPNGQKTRMPLQFDLTDAWCQFVNSNK